MRAGSLPPLEAGRSVLPLCNPRARGSVCACHERATAIQALDRTDHERNLSTWKEALSRALCTPLLHPRHTSRIQQGAAPYRDMPTLRERAPGLRWPSRQDEFGRRESDGLLDRHLAQSPCKIQGPTGRERAEADDPGTGHSHFDTSGRHRPRPVRRRRLHLSGCREAPPQLDWRRASRLGSHSKTTGGELFTLFQSGTSIRFRGSFHS